MAKYQPLSGMELVNMYHGLGGRGIPKIWSYRDINNKSIDQILGASGRAIILFMNSDNHGHWCALYRNKKGINFFDSYGNKPDDQYNFIPNHLAKSLNGYIKRLTSLLHDEARHGVPVHYNQYELQDWDNKNIATCGRWCVIRILYPEISVDHFKDIFLKRSLDPDDIITKLTTK